LEGNLLDLLEQRDLLISGKGLLPDRDGLTPLAPQLIPWDATFVGPVIVVALSGVLIPSSQSISYTTTSATVFIVRETN
jgi:hypothetical protein